MTTTHTRDPLRRLTLSAMLLSIGLILPFFTGQIQEIGSMLLPMHIPVLLCGLLCGWQYGGAVGLVLPLLRSLLFGMPRIYPNALAMSVELAVYGLIIGLIYGAFKRQNVLTVYISLLPAMLAGRVAWGGVQVLLLGLGDGGFGWPLFVAGAFTTAIPGILLQLVLIPAILSTLHLTGLARFRRKEPAHDPEPHP